MEFDFKVEGFREMSNVLKKLDRDVERKLGLSALRSGARKILAEAKRRVRKKTRRLEKAIIIKALPKKSKVIQLAIGVKRGKKRNDETGAWYGHLIEFGTKFMPAKPYLRPALDSRHKEAIRVVGKRLWQLINKTVLGKVKKRRR